MNQTTLQCIEKSYVQQNDESEGTNFSGLLPDGGSRATHIRRRYGVHECIDNLRNHGVKHHRLRCVSCCIVVEALTQNVFGASMALPAGCPNTQLFA